MKIQKIGVMTSGGDAPGMNAAIRAVVRASYFHKIGNCIGIYEGYKGLIEGDFVELGPRDVGGIIHRGGTILRTARCEAFKTPKGQEKAYENLQKNQIDALVVIGGDGSFTGAMKLGDKYNFPIVGIPGTIDNDIYGSDFSIGYDTALNVVVEAIDKIRDTAISHNRLFFVEVMGRNSGFIALNAGIATGALDILIPEENHKPDQFFSSIEKAKKAGKHSSIIVVAEGESPGEKVNKLVEKIKNKGDYDIRVSILGHIQRGGNPTCADRVLASRLGVLAVEALLSKKSGIMVGVSGKNSSFTPLKEAIDKQNKNKIDRELIRISDIVAI